MCPLTRPQAALGYAAEDQAQGFVDLDAVPAEGASIQVRAAPTLGSASCALQFICRKQPSQHRFLAARLHAPECADQRMCVVQQPAHTQGGNTFRQYSCTRHDPHQHRCNRCCTQEIVQYLLSAEARDLRPLLISQLVTGVRDIYPSGPTDSARTAPVSSSESFCSCVCLVSSECPELKATIDKRSTEDLGVHGPGLDLWARDRARRTVAALPSLTPR